MDLTDPVLMIQVTTPFLFEIIHQFLVVQPVDSQWLMGLHIFRKAEHLPEHILVDITGACRKRVGEPVIGLQGRHRMPPFPEGRYIIMIRYRMESYGFQRLIYATETLRGHKRGRSLDNGDPLWRQRSFHQLVKRITV